MWITVDIGLTKHPKMAQLPNDSARYGWLVSLIEAKTQRPPGAFASARHYKEVVGRFGRYLPDYIKAGLMDQNADGTLVIHDWRKHQYNVSKAKERETSRGHDVDTTLTESRPTVTVKEIVTEKGSKEPFSTRASGTPTPIGALLPGILEKLS